MENELVKDLIKKIKETKGTNTLRFNNISTDFTPKRKSSLKDRFKKSVKTLFGKLKKNKFTLAIKNWFYNKIKKPFKDRRDRKEQERYIRELKSNFSKKFNVDVEKTINIMNSPGYSPYQYDNNALLVENRLDINKRKSLYKFSPFMYAPEIVDIHNENLNKNNPSINEIIANDNNKASESLDKQLEFLRKRPHLTVGGRKIR